MTSVSYEDHEDHGDHEDLPALGDLDLADRQALRRVAGLSTELHDITEVEYRALRLERVVLIGVWTDGDDAQAENSLRELALLAETAGSQVLEGLMQRRPKPDPATYIGAGKAAELSDVVVASGADTVICDGELAPSQLRNLEDIVKVKVIDRTALILDIFAQHARSREGKAQVELAQLEYLLPRLRGWGGNLSRQVGGRAAGGVGIGGRGPGETKIELDRRRIRTRTAKLRRQLAAMSKSRDTMRAERRRRKVPAVAIAGYTNAGKSSLLNRLTGAGVLVEDALFATLDPPVPATASRRCSPPSRSGCPGRRARCGCCCRTSAVIWWRASTSTARSSARSTRLRAPRCTPGCRWGSPPSWRASPSRRPAPEQPGSPRIISDLPVLPVLPVRAWHKVEICPYLF